MHYITKICPCIKKSIFSKSKLENFIEKEKEFLIFLLKTLIVSTRYNRPSKKKPICILHGHVFVMLCFSGPSMTSASIKLCSVRKGHIHVTPCVNQNITNLCKNAKHRVTKVVRFTLDHFDPLLKPRLHLPYD